MAHTSSEILNIQVHYISRDGDTASINVTLDNVDDHLTVFSYNKAKKMIYGNPVNLSVTTGEIFTNIYSQFITY